MKTFLNTPLLLLTVALWQTDNFCAAADNATPPCFKATWDQAVSADQSAAAAAPVEAVQVQIDPQAGRRGAAGLNARRPGAHVTYATDGMWPREAGTVALWYRPAFDVRTNDARHGLLYTMTVNDPSANQFNIRFDKTAPPYDELQAVYQVNGEARFALASQLSWKAGSWHHIAVTWDKSDLILYLDGVATGKASLSEGRLDIAQPMVIGTVFGNEASADFDELTIWPVALSAEQIATLANAGSKP